MKLYQRIIAGGLVVTGLAVILYSGQKNTNESQILKQSSNTYITTEPKNFENCFSSEMALRSTTGDIDGDGLYDLIIGTPVAIKYFKNNGEGYFTEQQTVCKPKGFENYFSLNDIDSDNDLDLIVTTPFRVKTYQNNQGSFSEVQ